MEGEIRRIAKFLEIEVPEDKWPAILEHCSFKYMKENASRMSPPGAEAAWENGGETFIYKGTNGRWKESLTAEDVKRYDEKAKAELGEEGANWLANGGHISK